ncbi:SNF2 family N-terminal domain-containing protein [Tribonema minus]|uniref:SNF2 family N-terminal domain-containing protein n=1 Tax=Tribonema minus TaxID=303371 RepID=A0A835YWG4_9STRA|nr:SNF2 family N-terminal domain-containing protein [Tribonema minus]
MASPMEIIDLIDSDDDEPALPVNAPRAGQPQVKPEPGTMWAANRAYLVAKRERESTGSASTEPVSDDPDVETIVGGQPELLDTEMRPAKRAREGEDDEDIELVGTTGTTLPHLRCHCPDNPFATGDRKAFCDLCYCYVCDTKAKECTKWEEHCAATDEGALASFWKQLREQAHAKPGGGIKTGGLQDLRAFLVARNAGGCAPQPVPLQLKYCYRGHEVERNMSCEAFGMWHWAAFGAPASDSDYRVRYPNVTRQKCQPALRLPELGYPRPISAPDAERLEQLTARRCQCLLCKRVRGFYRLPASTQDMVEYNHHATVLAFPRLSEADKTHVVDVSIVKAAAEAFLELTTRRAYEKPALHVKAHTNGTFTVRLRLSRLPKPVGDMIAAVKEVDYAPAPVNCVLLGTATLAYSIKLRGEAEPTTVGTDKHQVYYTHYVTEQTALSALQSIVERNTTRDGRSNPDRLAEPAAFKAWGGVLLAQRNEESNFLERVLVMVAEKHMCVGVHSTYNKATNRGELNLQLQLRLVPSVTSNANAPQMKVPTATENWNTIVRRLLFGTTLEGPQETEAALKAWCGDGVQQRFNSSIIEDAPKTGLSPAWKAAEKERAKAETAKDKERAQQEKAQAKGAGKATNGGGGANDSKDNAKQAAEETAAMRSSGDGGANDGGSAHGGSGGGGSAAPVAAAAAAAAAETAADMDTETGEDAAEPAAGAAAAGDGGGAAAAAGSEGKAAGEDGAAADDNEPGDEEYEDIKWKLSYDKHANSDVSLEGLLLAARRNAYAIEQRLGLDEQACDFRKMKKPRTFASVTGFMQEIENLGHAPLDQQPEELTVTLYEHQRQGVKWMLDQEKLPHGISQHLWAPFPLPQPRPDEKIWFSPVLNAFTAIDPAGPKGGILCDEMGLGKTACTLALHLLNQPKTDGDESEWGKINRHNLDVTDKKRASEYGAHVSKGTLVVCAVSLVGQWVEEARRLCDNKLSIYPYHGGSRTKDPKKLAQYDIVVTTYGICETDMRMHNKEGNVAGRPGRVPPLQAINFWRCVLDESHTIKTTNRLSAAVATIISNRRWLVSGTPANSNLGDLTGQLKNLDIGNLRSALAPLRYADSSNEISVRQALPFLRSIMMRHTQAQTLNGRHILGLPPINKEAVLVKWAPHERTAYVKLEKELQSQYKSVRYLLRSAKGSHSMKVLTLMSQYRQACSGGAIINSAALAEAAAAGGQGATVMDALCPICNELLDTPAITTCNHVFCHLCITAHVTKKADKGTCPKCKKVVSLESIQLVGAGAAAAAAAAPEGSAATAGGGAPMGPNAGGVQGGAAAMPAGAAAVAGGGGDAPQQGGVVMESKLKVLVGMLAAIRGKDANAKALVFSQFTSTLRYLQRELPRHGFEFRTLTGDMSRRQRTKALEDFRSDPPTTIFLLSVRSGACGINLTAASHVFMLEPCLNLALEAQAIGRVHRLGQTRAVHVVKLYMEASVESRIIAMQTAKSDRAAQGSDEDRPATAAGSISKDGAKELRIKDYNDLFAVDDDGNDEVYKGCHRKSKKARRQMYRAPPPMMDDYGSGNEMYGSDDGPGDCVIA